MSSLSQQSSPPQCGIAQLNHWFAALMTCDPDEVVALYASNALLFSTFKGDVKRGHRKIRDYFAADFLPRHPIGAVVELYSRSLGELAVNSGIYNFQVDSEDAERVVVEARFTFVYQWMDEEWKIVEHHSSLNPESKIPEKQSTGLRPEWR